MSQRQQIVDAMKTTLERILPDNGFNTAAGRNVFVWRLSPIPIDKMPGIIFRDTTDPMEDEGIAERVDHVLTIEFEGHAASVLGSSAEEQARVLIKDLLKALKYNPTLGGLCYDMRVHSSDMTSLDLGERVVVAEITISIKYRTPRWEI